MPSYIYVMESGSGYCKIGKSDNPEVILKTIESEMGISITRIEKFECIGDPIATESKAHEILKQSSIFREWFSIDFEKACEIASGESKVNHKKIKTAGHHSQVNLYKATHDLIDEILDVELAKWEAPAKKPSKATIIHELVAKHYAKVVKR